MSTRRRGSRCWRSVRPQGSSPSRAARSCRRCSAVPTGTDVGEEIGRLVVALAPWMVMLRRRSRSRSRSCSSPVHVPAPRDRARHDRPARACRLPGQQAAGLVGIAIALALSTALAFGWMLSLLGADARRSGDSRARSPSSQRVRWSRSCRLRCFWPDRGGSVRARRIVAVLALVRPAGLTSWWHYLRELAAVPIHSARWAS